MRLAQWLRFWRRNSVNRKPHRAPRRQSRILCEPLEERRMLTLLGLVPQSPIMTYDSNGVITYDTAANTFDLTATPLLFKEDTTPPRVVANPRDLAIHIVVDNAGNLVGGTSGDDLVVHGTIDLDGNPLTTGDIVDGVLLTGEISGFGFRDVGVTDQFDFRFTPTGGDLLPFFAGKDIAFTTNSEHSSFVDFTQNFTGGAKGNIGTIDPLLCSIGGYVYVDGNNNGAFETGLGETGIPLTTVTLSGVNVDGVNVNVSQQTNGAGAYNFTGLRPGTYTITETQPAGYLDGKDTQGTPGNGVTSNDKFAAINLAGGVNGVNNNFGELLPASLAGFVYVDANNDGVFQNTELPIPGTMVTLSGVDDLGAPVSALGTTDGTGAYAFTNLRPGTYTINEVQPVAYLDGKDTQGTPGNGSASNDVFAAIALAAGVNGINNNFGELLPASLAGFVYVDANNDDVFQNTELPIPGTTVTLLGVDDLGAPVSGSTTTDGTGAYAFTNLRPGSYTITETQPSGYLDGKDTQGTPGNGAASNDVFATIGLAAGVNGVNNNFGELLPASLAGFVYVDANNDGVFQGTETPISGATVKLSGVDDLGAPVSASTTTNGTGAYSFPNLRPGTYTITETQPGGYLDGKDTQGTPGNGAASNDVFATIGLAAGVNGVNNNFGELLPASLAGFVYVDANNDGTFQGTESPISGVTVSLKGTDDLGNPVTATTTTNASGAYSFTGLRPGTYTITETQPGAYLDGKDTQGTPGNGTAGNDVFTGIALVAGVNGINNNFGERPKGSIGGTKFEDLTGNGLTGDDTPMAGVTIYIDANNNGKKDSGELSQVTDANGNYLFTGLAAGSYTVREVVPAGYVRTGPTLSDSYCINLTTGGVSSGNNFANAEICDESLTSIVYVINGTTAVTDLRGNTNEGDTVEVTFTVPAGQEPHRFTFVTYTAPGATFVAADASQQEIFDLDTGVFGPGTYTLTVTIPHSFYQIDFVCGSAIDQFGPANSNIFYSAQGRLLSADNDGTHAVVNNGSSLSGVVYVDANNNGQVGLTERVIPGVLVKLTGIDKYGKAVSQSSYTDVDGLYLFDNLVPGSYTITQTQPAGFTDGIDSLGSLGGTKQNDKFTSITLAADATGVNYNFGEQQTTGSSVAGNQTATLAFWNSSNGQALIKALDGGQNAKDLGNWLASSFANIYGSTAGTANMTGKTNAQIATYFQTLFSTSSKKIDAQVLALSLAVYVTNSGLAGNAAAQYGFGVSTDGLGIATVSVGSAGAAFGVDNNAIVTVMDLLIRTNARTKNGMLWDLNADGSLNTAETVLRNQASTLFDSILNT